MVWGGFSKTVISQLSKDLDVLFISPCCVVPIPSALYHTAGNRVDISLISAQFSRRVISLKNGVISVKTG